MNKTFQQCFDKLEINFRERKVYRCTFQGKIRLFSLKTKMKVRSTLMLGKHLAHWVCLELCFLADLGGPGTLSHQPAA